jgi:hypothetical protein
MADGRSHIQLHQREGDGKNSSRSQWVLARAPPFRPTYTFSSRVRCCRGSKMAFSQTGETQCRRDRVDLALASPAAMIPRTIAFWPRRSFPSAVPLAPSRVNDRLTGGRSDEET